MHKELQDAAETFRRIESALRESERRARLLFELAPDAIFVESVDGVVLDVNPAGCRLHEATREELVGRNVLDLVPPDRREEVRRLFSKWRTGELKTFEGVSYTKSGREIPVEINGCTIPYGSGSAVLLHVRDISRRKAVLHELECAKEFAENLIRTANILIVGLDTEGRVNLFNETAERVLGYRAADIMGRDWFELVVPEPRRAKVRDWFKTFLETAVDAGVVENPVLAQDGKERIISWRNNRIVENGRPSGMISFGLDMTARRAEEARQRALEKRVLGLQKLESLGLLAGGIAHDFNNLLTAIMGNVSLVRLEGHGTGGREETYLSEIEAIARQAADLCQQLLAYAGQARLEMQVTDLNAILESTRQLLQVSVSKKIVLRLQTTPNLPPIKADPSQLRQVLLNLVINASEAVGTGEGSIRVSTGTREVDEAYAVAHGPAGAGAGLYVFLEVADNGAGMSEEVRARIFDPFFTTKQSGRGLGLAAVFGIVRGHKALLEVRSKERMGTVFTILFPAATGAPPPSAPAAVAPGVEEGWRGSGLALFVDDEQSVQLLGTRMLRALGFEVLSAGNGADGAREFERHAGELRVVVLDVNMPRMSGLEVLARIRQKQPRLPVLLISGYPHAVEPAALDGHTLFLQKPFRLADLRDKLRALIE